jgi:hypothetical protein
MLFVLVPVLASLLAVTADDMTYLDNGVTSL